MLEQKDNTPKTLGFLEHLTDLFSKTWKTIKSTETKDSAKKEQAIVKSYNWIIILVILGAILYYAQRTT